MDITHRSFSAKIGPFGLKVELSLGNRPLVSGNQPMVLVRLPLDYGGSGIYGRTLVGTSYPVYGDRQVARLNFFFHEKLPMDISYAMGAIRYGILVDKNLSVDNVTKLLRVLGAPESIRRHVEYVFGEES